MSTGESPEEEVEVFRLMTGPFVTEEGPWRRPAFDGQLECPFHGHADLDRCTTCPHMMGLWRTRFEDAGQLVVVCGHEIGSGPEAGPV